MSNNKNDNFDEIDLNDLSTFFNSIGDSIGKLLYNVVQYFKRNFIFLILSFLIGGGIGYYLTAKGTDGDDQVLTASYSIGEELIEYEATVVINYGSYDYIKNLINKYSQDTLFLKKGLVNVHLKGIENLQDLINNVSVLSILSSKVDKNNELLASEMVDRNFHYHKLIVVANPQFDFDSFFSEVQQKIESESFIQSRKKVALSNLELRKVEIEKSILQSNEILSKGMKLTGDNIVSDLSLGKDKLIQELANVELSIIEGENALYKVYSSSELLVRNTNNKELFDKGSAKVSVKKVIVKTGFIFVFLFIVGNALVRTYKRYKKQVKEVK